MPGAGEGIGAFLTGLSQGLSNSDGGTEDSGGSNLSRTSGRKLGVKPGSGSNLSRWLGGKFGGASYSQEAMTPLPEGQEGPVIPSKRAPMRKGGRIKKTGAYRLHAGEVVVPAKIVSALEKTARKKVRKASRSSSRR